MRYIITDSGEEIELDELLKLHLKTFDKFKIGDEIWNVKCPKNLENN